MGLSQQFGRLVLCREALYVVLSALRPGVGRRGASGRLSSIFRPAAARNCVGWQLLGLQMAVVEVACSHVGGSRGRMAVLSSPRLRVTFRSRLVVQFVLRVWSRRHSPSALPRLFVALRLLPLRAL